MTPTLLTQADIDRIGRAQAEADNKRIAELTEQIALLQQERDFLLKRTGHGPEWPAKYHGGNTEERARRGGVTPRSVGPMSPGGDMRAPVNPR